MISLSDLAMGHSGFPTSHEADLQAPEEANGHISGREPGRGTSVKAPWEEPKKTKTNASVPFQSEHV